MTPDEPKKLEKERGLQVDPLYLTALASLGMSVSAKLTAPPANASIAVLPFLNMGGDPEQEHFTDGLTEDIITDLSNVPGFFVIARNSTFAYKGKPSDVRHIARDLGVKYILEGSARRLAQRLRVNVQLIDAAEGGNHIWAERFDREIADIFAVQDEVTRRVVGAISGKLSANQVVDRYRPASLEAYDLCVRSRHQCNLSPSANAEARSNFERAITLDPDYCEAYWNLAFTQCFGWLYWGESEQPNRQNAIVNGLRAIELDPKDSSAHRALGHILLNERRWEESKSYLDAAIRLNPNGADAFASLAEFHAVEGNLSEALASAATAFRLNPAPPEWYFWILGFVQIMAGRYEDAVATLRRDETYGTGSRLELVAALSLVGRLPEAKEEANLLLAANPNFTIRYYLKTTPFKNPTDADVFVKAFRLVGLPE